MGAQNIVKEINQYQKKSLHYVQRLDTNRIPKQALQCRPKGWRNVGRPRKRLKTNFTLRIKEQETRLTLHEHDDDDDSFSLNLLILDCLFYYINCLIIVAYNHGRWATCIFHFFSFCTLVYFNKYFTDYFCPFLLDNYISPYIWFLPTLLTGPWADRFLVDGTRE
jgi:hypothetical protein